MIQLIRGFRDILPGEAELWQHIEKTAIVLLEAYGFRELRLPLLEKSELFARSIGEETDIVEKEMYTFADRRGDLVTLRPEATASVVRAYIQHKLHAQDPVQKFYTIGPMFRRERPQKGRYRQFYQINAEVLGVDSPLIDAQLIFILTTLFARLAVRDVAVHLNSLGCPACRPAFRAALSGFLSGVRAKLCTDCVRRSERNPLRVLDCKVPGCREATQGAPVLLDFLCSDCSTHFRTVQDALRRLELPFEIDSRLVRGLDYYTRTTFEVQTFSQGAQNAVAGGGRYDGLIRLLGGPDLPATGFAIGFDRLVEVVGLNRSDFVKRPDVFMAALGEKSIRLGFEWACALGLRGIAVETDFNGKSLKSLMKRADRMGAAYVLIVGDNELEKGEALLRNMATKGQAAVSVAGIVDDITAIIRRESNRA